MPAFPGTEADSAHCFGAPKGSAFNIRGPQYLSDKKKISSDRTAYKCLGTDVTLSGSAGQSKGAELNVCASPGSFVSRLRAAQGEDAPFVICFNFSLGWGFLTAYFAPRHGGASPLVGDEAVDALIERLVNSPITPTDNAWRDKRLKVIPRLTEAPIGLNKIIPERPAIVGTKVTCTYHRGEGYFEVDLQVASSRVGSYMLGAASRLSHKLIIDLGFVLEGQSAAELPERVLCAVTLCRFDREKCPVFADWVEEVSKEEAS